MACSKENAVELRKSMAVHDKRERIRKRFHTPGIPLQQELSLVAMANANIGTDGMDCAGNTLPKIFDVQCAQWLMLKCCCLYSRDLTGWVTVESMLKQASGEDCDDEPFTVVDLKLAQHANTGGFVKTVGWSYIDGNKSIWDLMYRCMKDQMFQNMVDVMREYVARELFKFDADRETERTLCTVWNRGNDSPLLKRMKTCANGDCVNLNYMKKLFKPIALLHLTHSEDEHTIVRCALDMPVGLLPQNVYAITFDTVMNYGDFKESSCMLNPIGTMLLASVGGPNAAGIAHVMSNVAQSFDHDCTELTPQGYLVTLYNKLSLKRCLELNTFCSPTPSITCIGVEELKYALDADAASVVQHIHSFDKGLYIYMSAFEDEDGFVEDLNPAAYIDDPTADSWTAGNLLMYNSAFVHEFEKSERFASVQ